MSLNIKDEEAHRLARELARRMGETVTTAVKVAIKERLERQEASARPKRRSEILREYSEKFAPLFDDGRNLNDLSNELYDEETGLPK